MFLRFHLKVYKQVKCTKYDTFAIFVIWGRYEQRPRGLPVTDIQHSIYQFTENWLKSPGSNP